MTEKKDQGGQPKSKKLVSPSQVTGGALASVTAAYLGSHLGVAGTFWGAGLTSVIISVGGAVYQRSLEGARDKATVAAAKTALTRAKRQSLAIVLRPPDGTAGRSTTSGATLSTEDLDRLREARSRPEIAPVVIDSARQVTLKIQPVPGALRPGMHWPGGDHVVDHPDVAAHSEPTVQIRRADADSESQDASGTGTKLIEKDALPSEPPRRIRWTVVAVTSGLVFVLCILLITGIEGITGKPLSGGERGTSLGRMLRPNPPVPPSLPTQPTTTTGRQRPSQESEPTTTVQPSQQPSAEPTSTTPPPPSQTVSSPQSTPTSSATPTTTSSTAQQAPESGPLLPGT